MHPTNHCSGAIDRQVTLVHHEGNNSLDTRIEIQVATHGIYAQRCWPILLGGVTGGAGVFIIRRRLL